MENNNKLAPICLFVYSSLNETKLTVESLQLNKMAAESQLFIFSDGAKNNETIGKVQAVRDFIHTIGGFASVMIYESEVNMGLANSIIAGVTKIITEYGKVIVVEDDLILSENFLCFMNQSLTFYELEKRVLSVSGYSFPLKYPKSYNYDIAFSIRASSWGWATWKDRWESVDWEVKSYKSFKYNLFKRFKFNLGGSDMARMLDDQMTNKKDSWAIRFCYHQYQNHLLDVYPVVSKVINIGFGENATNTKNGYSRFRTTIDTSKVCSFKLAKNIELSFLVMLQFNWHYSIIMRIISKFDEFI
ncbi:MAG: glycosyl transferase [Paludibacter sp.]|nr:glycosyl transferase [Paludibacter sp.]